MQRKLTIMGLFCHIESFLVKVWYQDGIYDHMQYSVANKLPSPRCVIRKILSEKAKMLLINILLPVTRLPV